MPFPARNLTNQYISLSFQDIVQRYTPPGTSSYFLDGLGNELFVVDINETGQKVLTAASTASYSLTCISSSYSLQATLAQVADVALIADTASLTLSASYTITSSVAATASLALSASVSTVSELSNTASLAITSSNATTASYLSPGASVYLSQSWIEVDISSSTPPYQGGRMFWDYETHTYAIQSGVGNTTLQIGQEQWIHVTAGENIPNGSPVRISGSMINPYHVDPLPLVWLSKADVTEISSSVIGIATHTIGSGSHGFVTTTGIVHDLNTSAFNVGDTLYLSPNQSGSIINTTPDSPYPSIIIGICVASHLTSGSIYVHPSLITETPNLSSGVTAIPTITDNGNGTFSVGTGSVNLYSDISGSTKIKNYTVPGNTFSASLNQTTYLYYYYNGGTPTLNTTNDASIITGFDQANLGFIFNYANKLSIVNTDQPGLALSNKINRKLTAIKNFYRESGLALSETGSRNLIISSGNVWYGINRYTLDSFNSTTGSMYLCYHSASAWTSSLTTQYNNTQYDNGTSLITLGNNRYAVNYVYRNIGTASTAMVVLGTGNYTLAEAQASQPPSNLPSVVSSTGVLVGRIIVQRDAASATQTDSAFDTVFTPSPTTLHNDLSQLQGGSSGEYYHLTATEYGDTSSGSFVRQTGSVSNAISASTATSASFSITSSFVLLNGTDNYFPLWKTNVLTPTSSLYQSASGNIGIGTTTPTSKLYVATSNVSNDGLLVENTIGTTRIQMNRAGTLVNGGFLFSTAGTSYWYLALPNDNTNNLAIIDQQNLLTRMYIKRDSSGGFIGLSTNNPQAKLHIQAENASYKNLILQQFSASTANFIEFQSGSGAALSSINSNGQFVGTASYAITASYASLAQTATSASSAVTASFSLNSTNAVSASFATTASVYNENLRQGKLWIGQGAGTGAQNASLAVVDISYGGSPSALHIGADLNLYTRTDNTRKFARFTFAPYAAARKPIALLLGDSQNSTTVLSFGGGSSILDPATQIDFYTGVVNGTGSARLSIDSAGSVTIGGRLTAGSVTSSFSGNLFGTATSASYAPTTGLTKTVYYRDGNNNPQTMSFVNGLLVSDTQ